MKKILVLNTIGMGYEGISSVIMNYLENMDRRGLDLHVCVCGNIDSEYLKRISAIAKVVFLPNRKHDFINYVCRLAGEFRGGYDVFHVHGNSATMFVEVFLAKILGVKKVITHVHNTTCEHPIINKLLKGIMNKMSDVRIACSLESGRLLYEKKAFVVINNAIDLNKYAFKAETRKKTRKELEISNEYVVGHSGSFIEQKNHSFLIDIFYEFQQLIPCSKLMLLSDGPNINLIKEKTKALGIENKVLFLGRKSDAYLYYNAMDCFVMPSKWEGLPLVALESQASGLPVFISENVTRDVKCTSRIKFISLDKSPKQWAEEIYEKMLDESNRIEGVNKEMINGAFDINGESNKLREIYFSN